MNDEKEDENPWDEEDAGRTLATASPSFDSNVPSPITAPPPPIEPAPTVPRPFTAGAVRPMSAGNKPMPKATLVGLNPADFIKTLPRAGSQPRMSAQQAAAAAVAPRFPTPTPAPASASRSSNAPNPPDVDDDDSPTMLGARAPGEPLGDSDLPPPGAIHDKFAETMALDADDGLLPDLAPLEDIDEATKVGAHAKELHRRQDAHVVVGQGAVGDEATLAIPASAALGLLPDPSTLGPPLPPQTPPQPPVGAPARFPSSPGFPPVNALDQTHMAHEPYPPQAPPPWQPPPQAPWQQSVAPMPPSQQMAPYQHQPPYQQPSSNPAIQVAQPYPQQQQQPQQGWGPQPGMTPYSMGPQPPPAAPAPAPAPGFQLTPQVMLLAGVGVVCLAIFIIGIVLFVTTKF